MTTRSAAVSSTVRPPDVSTLARGSPRSRLTTAYEWSRPKAAFGANRTRTTSGARAATDTIPCSFRKTRASLFRDGPSIAESEAHPAWTALRAPSKVRRQGRGASSEHELEPELHLARVARTVGQAEVGGQSESRDRAGGGDVARVEADGQRVHHGVDVREHRAVQDVEHLETELRLQTAAERDRAVERHVDLKDPRAIAD